MLEKRPEIEGKVIAGTLNPSTVSKAIQFINKESKLTNHKMSIDEKREVFAQIENLSERAVERELQSAGIQPAVSRP